MRISDVGAYEECAQRARHRAGQKESKVGMGSKEPYVGGMEGGASASPEKEGWYKPVTDLGWPERREEPRDDSMQSRRWIPWVVIALIVGWVMIWYLYAPDAKAAKLSPIAEEKYPGIGTLPPDCFANQKEPCLPRPGVQILPRRTDQEMYDILFNWATNLTGYAEPKVRPIIILISHDEMEVKACGGRQCKVIGLNQPGSATIYIDSRLNPQDDVYARSVLIHEFVHYLQQTSGPFGHHPGAITCEESVRMEREAYAVQSGYMVAMGVYHHISVTNYHLHCEDSKPVITLPGANR